MLGGIKVGQKAGVVVVWWAGLVREWMRLEGTEGSRGIDCIRLWRSTRTMDLILHMLRTGGV